MNLLIFLQIAYKRSNYYAFKADTLAFLSECVVLTHTSFRTIKVGPICRFICFGSIPKNYLTQNKSC